MPEVTCWVEKTKKNLKGKTVTTRYLKTFLAIEKSKALELINFHFWEATVFCRSQEKLLEGLLKAIEEG